MEDIYTIGIDHVLRVPMFVSNSMGSNALKPVGILIERFKHLRLEGGGVEAMPGPWPEGASAMVWRVKVSEAGSNHSLWCDSHIQTSKQFAAARESPFDFDPHRVEASASAIIRCGDDDIDAVMHGGGPPN